MSDLNAKIVADLKRELAEARAEIEQQRTRAEAAEQELREERSHNPSLCTVQRRTLQAKLAAIRAHLAGVDLSDLSTVPVRVLVAAAREALEP